MTRRPTLATTKAGTTHSRIRGVGGYRPARVVTNEDVITRIDSSTRMLPVPHPPCEASWLMIVAELGSTAALLTTCVHTAAGGKYCTIPVGLVGLPLVGAVGGFLCLACDALAACVATPSVVAAVAAPRMVNKLRRTAIINSSETGSLEPSQKHATNLLCGEISLVPRCCRLKLLFLFRRSPPNVVSR